tara:strand:- start:6922 stop:7317 length:396 start_codon:yes stop_codon:yes gene_type:complete
LYIPVLSGRPKDKYCVIASTAPRVILLLISSEVSQLKRQQPDQWHSQVVIDKASHPFLKRDSYIDCGDLFGYPPGPGGLANDLNNDPSRMLGKLSSDTLARVRAVVQRSRLLSPIQIDQILSSLPMVAETR